MYTNVTDFGELSYKANTLSEHSFWVSNQTNTLSEDNDRFASSFLIPVSFPSSFYFTTRTSSATLSTRDGSLVLLLTLEGMLSKFPIRSMMGPLDFCRDALLLGSLLFLARNFFKS